MAPTVSAGAELARGVGPSRTPDARPSREGGGDTEVMARPRVPYNPDPVFAMTPIDVETVGALLSDEGLALRDTKARVHFLRRVYAALSQARSDIDSLNRKLTEVTMRRAHTGASPTVSPRDMVRYLSPAELIAAAGPTVQAQHDQLVAATEAAEAREAAAAEEVAALTAERDRLAAELDALRAQLSADRAGASEGEASRSEEAPPGPPPAGPDPADPVPGPDGPVEAGRGPEAPGLGALWAELISSDDRPDDDPPGPDGGTRVPAGPTPDRDGGGVGLVEPGPDGPTPVDDEAQDVPPWAVELTPTGQTGIDQ